MSYWLWRGLMICLVLGTIQWGYMHPESQLSQFAVNLYHDAKIQFTRATSIVVDFITQGLTVSPR